MLLKKIAIDYKISVHSICCKDLEELMKADSYDHGDLETGDLLLSFQTSTGVIYRKINFCPFCGENLEIAFLKEPGEKNHG